MKGTGYIAGVDEAGRGPLAGPVVAAAVILAGGDPIAGLADSKTLTARRRERLAVEIRARALAWSVGYACVEEIDRLNILQASLLAMRRAVLGLALTPDLALVDGNQAPKLPVPVSTLVRGDRLRADIGAASILAKTVRDRYMARLDERYPGYRFAAHMGYPTVVHRDAIARLGVTPEHRRSFAPVRAALVSQRTAQAV